MRSAFAVLLAAFPLAAAVPETIPIEIRSNLPLVTVSLNGSGPLTFIIDSAAGRICIDRNIAGALGLTPLGQGTNSGSGGRVISDVLPGVPIQIGSHEFTPDQIRAIDFSGFAHVFSQPVHGILGRPFFDQFAVEIDYPNSSLRLLTPGKYAIAGKALPLRLGKSPTIKGRIRMPGGELFPARLEVDTGSGGMLILAEPFIRKHGLLDLAGDLEPGNGSGVGGVSEFLAGKIGAVEVAGFIVEHPETRFAQGGKGVFAEDYRDGNLGGEFLRNFKVIFDFPHSSMILDPAKE